MFANEVENGCKGEGVERAQIVSGHEHCEARKSTYGWDIPTYLIPITVCERIDHGWLACWLADLSRKGLCLFTLGT